nr:MAG TPA: hypothetical protein [Caudoviricetes sp.]
MPEASYAAEVVRRDFVQRLRPPLPDYAATSAEGGFNPRQRLPRCIFTPGTQILLCGAKARRRDCRHGGLFFVCAGDRQVQPRRPRWQTLPRGERPSRCAGSFRSASGR